MFVLTKVTATVAHLNTRLEKHGEEDVLAADIKFTTDVPNTFLDKLSPGLLVSLYRHEGETPGEQLGIDSEHRPVLRYPQIDAIKWDGKIEAAEVVLHGKNKAENTVLEANVTKLHLVCKEGGTVTATFLLQMLVDSTLVAQWSELLGKSVKLSVIPPLGPDTPPVE